MKITRSTQSPGRSITTLIALGVGTLHFVTGKNYRGPFPLFVNGYLIDILAYTGGVTLGLLHDLFIFPRLVLRW